MVLVYSNEVMRGKLLERLVDFVYPTNCVGCDRLGVWLCEECRLKLETVEQVCPMCRKESLGGNVHRMCAKKLGMDGLTAVYSHNEEVMRRIMNGVKFDFNWELLTEFVRLLDFETERKFELVVPVPLHIYRRNWRGFNQAEVIAEEVGRQLSLPVVEVLRRVRRGKQQSKIKSRRERARNIKGVFEMDELGFSLHGRLSPGVLLVDDVFTSGATMREASRLLKQAGARYVWGLALCRQV